MTPRIRAAKNLRAHLGLGILFLSLALAGCGASETDTDTSGPGGSGGAATSRTEPDSLEATESDEAEGAPTPSPSLPDEAPPTTSSDQFQTPSGNIACYRLDDSLRCDISSGLQPLPPKPSSCEFDWGLSVGMEERGAAEFGCVSDTVLDPTAPELSYGSTWQRGQFMCESSTEGLRCTNGGGHGFFLSRERSQLF